MGMTKTLLKGASYMTAPAATFAFNNPKKAALVKATEWATKRVLPRRKRPSYGAMALKGLGAAAVAVPLGMWLGSKLRSGPDQG